MTRPYQRKKPADIRYPHLKVARPHILVQIDIVPHYLKGGQSVACFNAIDVASRYPAGQAYAQRRSREAEAFLLHAWQELGMPQYTQVDNEGCFSGGMTHPYVLGRVIRLALQAGTQLVFSPTRHPASNAYVERFHRDYNKHVWEGTYLDNIPEVQHQGQHFLALYRTRPHPRLHEQTPADVHRHPNRVPESMQSAAKKRPLYAGQVHFMRKVLPDRTISVLNVSWPVPAAIPDQGVWATLFIRMSGAQLVIYDAAPDAPARKRVATYPFKLSEPVLPHPLHSHDQTTSIFSSIIQYVARISAYLFGGTMS